MISMMISHVGKFGYKWKKICNDTPTRQYSISSVLCESCASFYCLMRSVSEISSATNSSANLYVCIINRLRKNYAQEAMNNVVKRHTIHLVLSTLIITISFLYKRKNVWKTVAWYFLNVMAHKPIIINTYFYNNSLKSFTGIHWRYSA